MKECDSTDGGYQKNKEPPSPNGSVEIDCVHKPTIRLCHGRQHLNKWKQYCNRHRFHIGPGYSWRTNCVRVA